MSGYNYNLYSGPGIPDMGVNGLPLVLADANLPTQGVMAPPMQRSTELSYSPYMVESDLRTPAPAKDFKPTAQPVAPKLWHTVLRAVIGGGIKTGTNYAATGDYTTEGGFSAGVTPSSGGTMSKLPSTPTQGNTTA